jgi:hypothetical protein
MDELLQLIRAWSARARLQRSLHWLFLGLACGLGFALVIAVLARIVPIVSSTALIAISIACAVIGTLTAAAWPWLQTARAAPATWARQFDLQFQLKERLSTAVELREGTVNTSNERMRMRQQNDAGKIAEGLDIQRLLPLRLSQRFALYAFAIAIALVATIALPNPQQEVLASRAQLQQVLDDQVQQLEALKQQTEQSQSLSEGQKKDVIQALQDAQQALSDPTTAPETALAAINDAQSKLDALRDQNWPDQRDDLQRAGQSLAPNEQTNPLANSLQNGDFQKAAEQMNDLTQKDGKPLNDEQRQQLANQLEQMARNVQNSNPAMANQLRQAAQKLREGQDATAQQILKQVADTLNKAGEKETTTQQIEKAQAGVEDARRAVSEASGQQEQNSAQNGQQQDNESAQSQQTQQSAGTQQGNQANAGQPNRTQVIQGQGDQGDTPTGAEASNSGQSGNTEAGPGQNGDGSHHEDTGSDNSVYAPQARINNAGQNVGLPDQNPQNAPNPNAPSNPGVSNQASVPYQEVYADYARAADEALQNGQVPSGLRDYVHDYFSSLDPRQRK